MSKFSEGLAEVKINDKWGFINKSGAIVIMPQFEYVHSFSEGYAAAKLNGLWGFIDRQGKWIINPKFDMTSDFENGIVQVLLPNGKEGFIDRFGNWFDSTLHAMKYIQKNSMQSK